ncbi:hypothetical protein [Shinella sp. JR1-6]|uniref:hypothetical protein n=1 Tax=Shinella sp. JR1-6 TaxID=2527671 RepID=UPI00102D58B4|nr:hypothetical protein [Shinella sp. JR1-6]TAA49793.1 hypothetical protein EXZ48_33900 [Shinella sp. JR1-6]
MALDPRIEAVRTDYGLAVEDFWQIPQNKQWVCKHAALEVVATKAGVEWSAPQIIEAKTADGIAVLAVTGKMGTRVEWATGEASPKNNKNSYPWAMAEKRAKDRVVLKLVGIHGLVYSEDEADDFKTPAKTAERREVGSALWDELSAIRTMTGLQSFWIDHQDTIKAMDEVNRRRFTERKEAMKRDLSAKTDMVKDIEDTFPGSRVVNETVREQHVLEAGE